MAAHVASGNCAGGKDSEQVRLCAPGYHEREWLKPFLTGNSSKLKPCTISGCPCNSKSLGKRKAEKQ